MGPFGELDPEEASGHRPLKSGSNFSFTDVKISILTLVNSYVSL